MGAAERGSPRHGQGRLVGRDDQLRSVRAPLQAIRDGHAGAVVVLEGEAGIGKTALAATVADEAAAMGLDVRRAAVDRLDRTRPFGPLLGVLALAPPEPAAAPPGVRAAHRQVAALLQPGAGGGRHSPLQAAPDARAALVEGLVGLVEAWSAASPLVLVLDDLQWADGGSMAVVHRLVRVVRTSPLVVVATHRPVPRRRDLAALVPGTPGVEVLHLPLGPLPSGAVQAIARRQLGAAPSAVLGRVLERAAGNPFLVGELLAALGREGHLAVADGVAELVAGGDERIVVTIPRDAVVRRMADLDPATAHVLQVAAALGRSFAVDEVAAVLGRPVAPLLPHLHTAQRAGLVVDDGHALRFRHDLVRDAVESSLSPAALTALHRDIAGTLAALGAPSTRVAAHALRGARPGDAETVAWLRAAAADIAGQAPKEAAELLERVVELVPVTDPSREAVVTDLVEAQLWSGHLDRAAELAAASLALPGEPALRSRLEEALARALVLLGRPAEAAELLHDPEGSPPSDPWRVALRALIRTFALDLDGAWADASGALDLVAVTPEPWAETLGWVVRGWVEHVQGVHAAAVSHFDRAVVAADRSPGREAHRLVPHVFRGVALASAGRTEDSEATLRHGRQLADRLGTVWAVPFFHYAAAVHHLDAGRWDELLAECDAGLRFAEDHDVWLAAPWACAVAGIAQAVTGDLAGAEARADRGEALLAAGGAQFGLDWSLWLRALCLEAGQGPEVALTHLEVAWAGAEGLQARAAQTLFGPDLVRLLLECGRVGRAREVVVALEWSGPGAVAEERLNDDAKVLRCRGSVDLDVVAIERARRLHEAHRRPVEVLLDDEARILALARCGRRAEATSLLRRFLEDADRLGAVLVGDRLLRAVGPVGVRARRVRPRRPVSGWDALTETEKLVAARVADGHSNPEVAEVLGVSRRTVESHLYRIFAKLEVTNRTQLALRVRSRPGG